MDATAKICLYGIIRAKLETLDLQDIADTTNFQKKGVRKIQEDNADRVIELKGCQPALSENVSLHFKDFAQDRPRTPHSELILAAGIIFVSKGLPKSNLYAIKEGAKCEERENSGFAESKRRAVTG